MKIYASPVFHSPSPLWIVTVPSPIEQLYLLQPSFRFPCQHVDINGRRVRKQHMPEAYMKKSTTAITMLPWKDEKCQAIKNDLFLLCPYTVLTCFLKKPVKLKHVFCPSWIYLKGTIWKCCTPDTCLLFSEFRLFSSSMYVWWTQQCMLILLSWDIHRSVHLFTCSPDVNASYLLKKFGYQILGHRFTQLNNTKYSFLWSSAIADVHGEVGG